MLFAGANIVKCSMQVKIQQFVPTPNSSKWLGPIFFHITLQGLKTYLVGR